MTQKVVDKIYELRDLIKSEMPQTTTNIKIFMNCEECTIQASNRTPEQLKKQDISMRNISGEWIK